MRLGNPSEGEFTLRQSRDQVFDSLAIKVIAVENLESLFSFCVDTIILNCKRFKARFLLHPNLTRQEQQN